MVVRFTLERMALGKASCHLRTELGTEVLRVLGSFKQTQVLRRTLAMPPSPIMSFHHHGRQSRHSPFPLHPLGLHIISQLCIFVRQDREEIILSWHIFVRQGRPEFIFVMAHLSDRQNRLKRLRPLKTGNSTFQWPGLSLFLSSLSFQDMKAPE